MTPLSNGEGLIPDLLLRKTKAIATSKMLVTGAAAAMLQNLELLPPFFCCCFIPSSAYCARASATRCKPNAAQTRAKFIEQVIEPRRISSSKRTTPPTSRHSLALLDVRQFNILPLTVCGVGLVHGTTRTAAQTTSNKVITFSFGMEDKLFRARTSANPFSSRQCMCVCGDVVVNKLSEDLSATDLLLLLLQLYHPSSCASVPENPSANALKANGGLARRSPKTSPGRHRIDKSHLTVCLALLAAIETIRCVCLCVSIAVQP